MSDCEAMLAFYPPKYTRSLYPKYYSKYSHIFIFQRSTPQNSQGKTHPNLDSADRKNITAVLKTHKQIQNQMKVKVKQQQHERHLEMFEREFLHDQTQLGLQANKGVNKDGGREGKKGLQYTEENLMEGYEHFQQLPDSMLILARGSGQSNNEGTPVRHPSISKSSTQKPTQPPKKSPKRKYKFIPKYLFLQILLSYALTIGLMYLNKVLYFPFFQALLILIISISSYPQKLTTFFILLGIPITIANYNIGTWVLSYPQIVICYLSCYLFMARERSFVSLFWILEAVLVMVFGFILLPGVIGAMGDWRVVGYYLFPWMVGMLRVCTGVLNQFIGRSNVFLMSVSMFVSGLCYGMLLTLDLSTIQFWYLLVLLTLDIVNTRYQFLQTLIKTCLKIRLQPPSLLQAECSGYTALHSFHTVILVYLICSLNLDTAHFSFNLAPYLNQKYKPAVIWVFFTTYEIICLVKLRNREDLVVFGVQGYGWGWGVIRVLGLGLGMWFFFLGLGVPSEIFLT